MDRLKLIDDTILVTNINKDGKFFEKGTLTHSNLAIVSRIEAKSEVMKLDIQLDVNTDIYPMEKEAYYSMVLATSINTDGSEEFDLFRYQHEGSSGPEGLGSLMEQYQYVMHGKVFKYNIDNDKM